MLPQQSYSRCGAENLFTYSPAETRETRNLSKELLPNLPPLYGPSCSSSSEHGISGQGQKCVRSYLSRTYGSLRYCRSSWSAAEALKSACISTHDLGKRNSSGSNFYRGKYAGLSMGLGFLWESHGKRPMGWYGTGINCYGMGMGQINTSHGQP